MRERTGLPVEMLAQVEDGCGLFNSCEAFLAATAPQRMQGSQADVVAHRHALREAAVLEGSHQSHPADRRGGLPRALLAEYLQRAGRGLVEAADHVERGALARAVGTDQAEDLAGTYFEVELVDGHQPTESAGQVGRLQQRLFMDRHGGFSFGLSRHAARASSAREEQRARRRRAAWRAPSDGRWPSSPAR